MAKLCAKKCVEKKNKFHKQSYNECHITYIFIKIRSHGKIEKNDKTTWLY